MGWSGGTEIAEVIADLCTEYVPLKLQKQFLKKAFGSLESMDWDCQGDLLDHENPMVGKVIKEMNPGWFEDEE